MVRKNPRHLRFFTLAGARAGTYRGLQASSPSLPRVPANDFARISGHSWVQVNLHWLVICSSKGRYR